MVGACVLEHDGEQLVHHARRTPEPLLELAQRGLWTLDDPVAKWLIGFPNDQITLRALLTHTSGLPPHREFFRLAGGPPEIRRQVYAEAALNAARPFMKVEAAP